MSHKSKALAFTRRLTVSLAGSALNDVESFRHTASGLVLPALESRAAEAEAELERLRSLTPTDAGGLAEQIADYSLGALAVEQTVVKVLVVGLHHLFQQQKKRLGVESVENISDGLGLDASQWACNEQLDELRLAANTIKHGQGGSAKQLTARRPDLFPQGDMGRSAEQVADAAPADDYLDLAPLATWDTLNVSERDFEDWCDAVKSFWEGLIDAAEPFADEDAQVLTKHFGS